VFLMGDKFILKNVLKYGLSAAILSCIFGLLLYGMTADLLSYGNYNNALGRYVPIQFYFMSITAAVIAAYGVSRYYAGEKDISQRKKAVSGIVAALATSLIPCFIYIALIMTLINDLVIQFFVALQIYLVPLPAAILGGLIGYFINGEKKVETNQDFKRYIVILSAVLLLELAIPLVIIYTAIVLGLVPYDQGRVVLY